jgi:hypothetical protein
MEDSIFEFTKKDLVSGKVYEPAWYRVRIDETTTEPSKDGGSTNHWINGTILFNADDGDRKYEDHPIRWSFNSKWMAPARGFFVALGTPEEDIVVGKRFSFTPAVGKELDVYIENVLFDGRQNNKVNGKFRLPRVA